jgi:hypothetical protein
VITDRLLSEIEAGEGEPLARAARRFPSVRNNRPATLSRVYRYVFHGVLGPDGQRVYLEAARCAGTWITTPGAIRRFISAQTPQQVGERAPVKRSPVARTRSSEQAAAELSRLGI